MSNSRYFSTLNVSEKARHGAKVNMAHQLVGGVSNGVIFNDL